LALPVFDKEEDVPEAFKAIYEERDGKWHPKATEVPDVSKLEATLQKERDDRKEADKRAKKAEEDLAALKLTKKAKENGVTDQQLQEIRDAEALARKPILDENEQLKAENLKVTLVDHVRYLALNFGVMIDRIDKAMKDLAPGPNGRIDRTEDKKGFLVRDAAGKVTAETVEDFLKITYKKECPFFYKGSGAGGSGAGGSDGDAEEAPATNSAVMARRNADIAGAL